MRTKILILTSSLNSLFSFRSDLIDYIEQRGSSCSAIGFGLISKNNNRKIKIYKIPFRKRLLSISFVIKSIFKINKIINIEKPDIIFVYQTISIYLALLVLIVNGKNRNVSIFFEGLGVIKEDSITGLLAKSILKILIFLNKNKNIKYLFANKENYNFLLKKITVRPNNALVLNGWGVNPKNKEIFFITKKKKQPIFLMASRILKSKGIFEYLDAAVLVKEKVPNAKFFLCGSFDETHPQGIKRTLFFQRLKSNPVFYLGFIKKMKKAYKRANIFVLPTYYNEGFPFSLLEAMAARLAILTTQTPGCNNAVVPGKNGFFVQEKNAYDLAEKMIKLAKDLPTTHKMGQESRRLVALKFDSRLTSKRVFNFISR